jgi:hypothetical protein
VEDKETTITWDECIELCDELLELYVAKLQSDPVHGMFYQQGMAVAMYKKLYAMEQRDRENEEHHED